MGKPVKGLLLRPREQYPILTVKISLSAIRDTLFNLSLNSRVPTASCEEDSFCPAC